MMLRFTLASDDVVPGDLTINTDHVSAVVEYEYRDRPCAALHMFNGQTWDVLDGNRDAAERIALARGQYEEMQRC